MLLIQDMQLDYAVPYSVTLKDRANCAEVTCINMHRYRCKMPVFLIFHQYWTSGGQLVLILTGGIKEGSIRLFFSLHITFYNSCMSLVTLCISSLLALCILNACHIIPTCGHCTIHVHRLVLSMFIASLPLVCLELDTK